MKSNMQHLPLTIMASAMVAIGMSWASAKSDAVSESRSAKADYIFLEGQNAYLNGDYDKYFQLTRRAFELDSTDASIAGEWAIVAMMDENTDNATATRAYQYLRDRFTDNPTNYFAGAMFANVAMQQQRFADAIGTWQKLDSLFPRRSEPKEEMARAYLSSYMAGDTTAFDKAMAIYDNFEAGAGKDISTISMKVKAYALKGDTAAIINELVALDSIAPHDSYTSLSLAMYYEYLDRPDQAIAFYDKACALDSTNGQAYVARADYYKSRGDSVAYDREVFHALRSHNLAVDNKINILRSYVADLYSDSTQETRIRSLFNDLQTMHAGEPEIHNLYAAYLYLRGDYKGAAEQDSYASDLDPNNEDIRTRLIQINMMAGDTISAINDAKTAINRFPDNLYFPLLLSYIYRDMGDSVQAVAVLDSVKIVEVNNPQAVAKFLASKGDVLSSVGDTVRALSTYDEAIALDPSNNLALNNAAYFIALSGGDLDKAERYSVRSLKGDEMNPTYLDTYAWIQFLKKNYTMAKIYIDFALNAYGSQVDEINIDEPDPDNEDPSEGSEIDEVSVAEEIEDPSSMISADVLDHAGDIYFMTGDKDKALEFWSKAHVLDPENALIQKKVTHKTIFFE